MVFKFFFVIYLGLISLVYSSNEVERRYEAIDSNLLNDVLDAEECHRQIRYIRRNSLMLLQFMDSGLRTPRGILEGNTVDMGNYHQCIRINQKVEEQDMHIEGKYCSILVPFNQSFHFPRPRDMRSTQFDPTTLRLDPDTISKIEEYNLMRSELKVLSGNFEDIDSDTRSTPLSALSSLVFRLAVCVPKPCTTEQAITSFFFNVSAVGFQFSEDYCRIPGDKPWAPVDYVAVGIFSVLGFITLISTSYDLCYRFLFKKDVKQMSTICRSFSVYTNGQRLTTFSNNPGSLQCLDGIRTLAMIWVIVGHSFSTEPFLANPLDSGNWMFSARALWITAATMTVDTFFTIAGVLLVYTTAGKMNQISFLKNIHWFYLNRFMRLTPLMAVTVLLQASYFNQFTDGPHWVSVAELTNRCRNNWWSTLIHLQNFINLDDMCVIHSWYVAIDFQLYVLSPLILMWVLSGKKIYSWIGLIGGLIAVLIASTIYSFHLNLPAGNLVPSRFPEMMDYMTKYYFNTLSRASPFFVGMVFGYIMHLYRKKRIEMPWIMALFFWACSAGVLGGIFYFKYRIKQFEWDNQLIDNLMNSFMRPSYASAICWLVIACVHGYSGPINWLLSLDVWRLPARLSYGMFLFHYPLMYSVNATMVTPIFFSVESFTFKFLSYLALSVVWSFVLTLLVDSPVTVLFKQLMDSAKPKKPAVKVDVVPKVVHLDNAANFNGNPKSIKDLDEAKEYDVNIDNTNEVDNLNTSNISSNEVLEKSEKDIANSNDTHINSSNDIIVANIDTDFNVITVKEPEVEKKNSKVEEVDETLKK